MYFLYVTSSSHFFLLRFLNYVAAYCGPNVYVCVFVCGMCEVIHVYALTLQWSVDITLSINNMNNTNPSLTRHCNNNPFSVILVNSIQNS